MNTEMGRIYGDEVQAARMRASRAPSHYVREFRGRINPAWINDTIEDLYRRWVFTREPWILLNHLDMIDLSRQVILRRAGTARYDDPDMKPYEEPEVIIEVVVFGWTGPALPNGTVTRGVYPLALCPYVPRGAVWFASDGSPARPRICSL